MQRGVRRNEEEGHQAVRMRRTPAQSALHLLLLPLNRLRLLQAPPQPLLLPSLLPLANPIRTPLCLQTALLEGPTALRDSRHAAPPWYRPVTNTPPFPPLRPPLACNGTGLESLGLGPATHTQGVGCTSSKLLIACFVTLLSLIY